MTTAAVDPGPTVSGIVRFELPKRAKQRESMTAAQIERQAKSLGESGAWDALMCFARPARYVGERRAMGLDEGREGGMVTERLERTILVACSRTLFLSRLTVAG